MRAVAVGGVLLALREHLVVAADEARSDWVLRRGRERQVPLKSVLRLRDAGLELIQRRQKLCLFQTFGDAHGDVLLNPYVNVPLIESNKAREQAIGDRQGLRGGLVRLLPLQEIGGLLIEVDAGCRTARRFALEY